MGKITVKHYLNTKLKPNIENGLELYPLYVQVTISRKTTQFRSFSMATMTIAEFEKYQLGLGFDAYYAGCEEIDGDYFRYHKQFLINEPANITKALTFMFDYSIPKNSIGIEGTIIKWLDDHYLKQAREALISMGWHCMLISLGYDGIDETDENLLDTKGWERENFYKVFNKDLTLIECLQYLKKHFGVNIRNRIPDDDLTLWTNIQLVLRKFDDNYLYVAFMLDYENIINGIGEIKDKAKFLKQIEEMIY